MGATALTVLGIIQTIIQLAPEAIKTVQDAQKFVQPLWDSLTKGKKVVLTDDERAALYAAIDQQYAESQTPLPPT